MESDSDPGRGWHDMGGAAFDGGVDRASHDHALWEKRVDALMLLCSARGLFTVDGLRRAIEDLGPGAFDGMSYYERWIASITRNLIEAGVFTVEEVNARMEAVAARGDTYGAASLERDDG